MQILENSILSAYDFVLFAFENCHSEECVEQHFESDKTEFVATDYNGKQHLFFIDKEQRKFKYIGPYKPTNNSL